MHLGVIVHPLHRRDVDDYADLRGDGFHYYLSRSRQGNRHQGWKDSADAVVYEDGSQVDPPIATCEEQGFAYAAKLQFSEVLWWLDRREEAKRLYHEAEEFKKRFNERFWMPDRKFVAFGLDSFGAQITSMDLLISLLTAPNSIVAECFERIGVTAAKLTELAVMAEQSEPEEI